MEPAEYNGVWWRPDAPQDRVAGILRYSQDQGLAVDLLGVMGPGRGVFVGPKYFATIQGSVSDCPYGQAVTLTGCHSIRSTTGSSGFDFESYRADRAFFGNHLSGREDFLFDRCDLTTTGLSYWASHRSGFRYDPTEQHDPLSPFVVRYVKPPSLEAPLPDGQLALWFGCATSSTLRERSVIENVAIDITVREPIDPDLWNDRYVYPILNLLTLATDSPNALTSWQLATHEGFQTSVRVVNKRAFKPSTEEQDVSMHGMLVPLQKYEDRFPVFVPQWLRVSATYRDACNIFFALWYAPGAYTDMRILGISQALELYYSRRTNLSSITRVRVPPGILASLPATLQPDVQHWVEGLTVDTFHTTLMQLASEHRTTLEPLGVRNLDALIDEIVAVRNHVCYRSAVSGSPENIQLRMFLVAETLACLMKSCLLAEIGFEPTERASLFGSNAMYSYLQLQWAEQS